jgi:ABC-type sulfate/molybdate transport systems ATPase subunit
LLLVLIVQPNVLLLDEPTNDLDLDTLRALEDFLDDWPGIAVVMLLVVTGAILLFNQQHSGDPLKVRRELRKF